MTRLAPLLIVLCAAPVCAQEKPKTLKLQLKVGQKTYAYGQVPQFDLRWVNGTDAKQQVVKPVDGSEVAFRFPEYVWTIERVDGKPLAKIDGGRCGNVNSLKPDDFVIVAPKADVALAVATNHSWLRPPGSAKTWLSPGKYRVSIKYVFDPKQVERCYGALNGDCPPEILERIKATAAITKTSNTIELEVAKPSEAEAKRYKAWQGIKPGATLREVEQALGAPDSKKTEFDGATLSFKVGGLFLDVSLEDGKVRSTYVRDWK